MKVLIAIDSFKGSVSSIEASKAITAGIRNVYPDADIVSLPLADGGEGTVECLVHATSGKMVSREVTGPLGEKVMALYGILGDGRTAVIEVAAACGLPLVPEGKRNPEVTTTYGVGELIQDAIVRGCREFIIGLGGSATNDAGVGMLQALGFQFKDAVGNEVEFGGRILPEICSIDLSQVIRELNDCTFRVACDVDNPLYGPNGAAFVYGPQKGASEKVVRKLDAGLRYFAEFVQKEIGRDVHSFAGAGAAGGLGAAFSAFLNGQLEPGIELIFEKIHMEEQIKGMDFVITGEGRMDAQTSMGKVPSGVARLAARYHIPVIALVGSVSGDLSELHQSGMTSCFPILDAPISLEGAMESDRTLANLQRTAEQLFRLIRSVNGKWQT
ncbi:glycerate kinase [Sporosarcina sp. 179-K 3D1 HS]|uniref:glycerate kinase family protein n=1 Tax=Sporosarcina sp. 179-K 3D1 HS TaxID=3232169 RepID=UPI0039A2661E